MPIDDPGWGDFTPPPAGQPQQQQPQQQQPQPQQPPQPQQMPPTQPQQQAPPPAGGPPAPSPFADPKVKMVLAAIVVAALAVGGYFMFMGGDDDEGDAKPAAAAGNDDSQDAPPGGDEVGTLPLQDYAEIANQICNSYAPDIQAASQAQDLQALAETDQAMLDELLVIPPPDESAELLDGMYADFQLAIDAIAAGDLQSAQQYASTASATASQLGLDACAST